MVDTTASQKRPRTSPKALPPYLLLRSGIYYFKRKVPRGFGHAFPQAREGQVWKSLGTDLVERARLLLAAELGEFELTLARARHVLARSEVTGAGESSSAAHQVVEPVALLKGPDAAPVAAPAAMGVTCVTPVRKDSAETTSVRPAAGGRLTMRHLLESWKVKQSRHRTIQTFETAVNEFHALHGALAAEDITREHARRYRDTLVERHLSDGTIANRLGFLGTLFRFGQVELIEHLHGNPFERIPVNGGKHQRVVKDRRAYTQQELSAIFSSKLYTQGYAPRGQGAQAAYWAPLLGPFVGARIEEIAQLRVDDVEQVNGTWCIRIWVLGADQHLKTPSSYRRVPLHEVLVRCGFLRFVLAQREAGHLRLFPSPSCSNLVLRAGETP